MTPDKGELLRDFASVLFDPDIKNALMFYNTYQNRGRKNTVALDLLRKLELLRQEYAKLVGQRKLEDRGEKHDNQLPKALQ